jgi:hypothetical protein
MIRRGKGRLRNAGIAALDSADRHYPWQGLAQPRAIWETRGAKVGLVVVA